MNLRSSVRFLLCSALFAGHLAVGSTAFAAPPWAKLIPYTKVDVDPDKDYELTESNGPWMVMCTSFSGSKAEEQAHALVLELREKYRLEAYTFHQHFDTTKPEVGLGLNERGGPKLMRNLHGQKRNDVAVLVGNFHSVEQPDVKKVLEKIKTAFPDSLSPQNVSQGDEDTLAKLRKTYRDMAKLLKKKEKGPMGSAFVTRNPLLPDEFFAPKGLDPFVVELNKGVKYSLLDCPGGYTVKVASFRGVESMKPKEFEQLAGKVRETGMTKLDEAADKANRLTRALRDKGVEAYQFHDRTESIVCVGSFDSVGQPRADGKIEINPAVHQVMESYGPIKKMVPGYPQPVVQVRMLDNIAFDPQPLPVIVPRQSIANDYVRRAGYEE